MLVKHFAILAFVASTTASPLPFSSSDVFLIPRHEVADVDAAPAPVLGIARGDGYVKPTVESRDLETAPAPVLGIAKGDGFVKPMAKKDMEDIDPIC